MHQGTHRWIGVATGQTAELKEPTSSRIWLPRPLYKLHLLNDGDLTFVLTSGGHNAGIVSEPGHPHRSFRIRLRPNNGHTLGPDDWQAGTRPQPGSWWQPWHAWLSEKSTAQIDPPPMGAPGFMPLCDAPGTYVLQK